MIILLVAGHDILKLNQNQYGYCSNNLSWLHSTWWLYLLSTHIGRNMDNKSTSITRFTRHAWAGENKMLGYLNNITSKHSNRTKWNLAYNKSKTIQHAKTYGPYKLCNNWCWYHHRSIWCDNPLPLNLPPQKDIFWTLIYLPQETITTITKMLQIILHNFKVAHHFNQNKAISTSNTGYKEPIFTVSLRDILRVSRITSRKEQCLSHKSN